MSLIESIGEPAMLEQLAEECAELAHACLKLARIERGDNPTPASEPEYAETIIEEMADVQICVDEIKRCEWWQAETYQDIKFHKLQRIDERIAAKKTRG